MGYGLGIFLLVIGAIMTFAVSDRIEGVDLSIAGWILMGAGLLSIILGLIQQAQRSNTRHTEVVDRRDVIDHRDVDI